MMIGPSGMDKKKKCIFFLHYLDQIVKSHYQMDHRDKFKIEIWIKENEKSNFISKKFFKSVKTVTYAVAILLLIFYHYAMSKSKI